MHQGNRVARRQGRLRAPRRRKALGQHHLKSGRLCRPLVEFLAPAGERVVEIGPGGGVLTHELLAAGARTLWAIELDLDWALHASRRFAGQAAHVVVGDALLFDYRRLPAPTLVAGNLPYQVATAILERLLPAHQAVPRAAFLLQKEVVDRLVARPGDAAYGALSVLVAARAEARRLATLPPGAFVPPPKVSSSYVGLLLRPPAVPETEMASLERVVHAAFGQRRKTLRNALATAFGREVAEGALTIAGIDATERAESLGLAEFLRLRAAVAKLHKFQC